jgi:hypothetical protein
MKDGKTDLRVRLDARLADALDRAAQRQFMTIAAYTRQTLLKRLRRDGYLVVDTQMEANGNDERRIANS